MIIIANWKAKVQSITDAKRLLTSAKTLAEKGIHQIILAPSAPYLGLLSLSNTSKKLRFAAQDITLTPGGAQTGEVTGKMLASVKATHVIIGHSERRALGESDADILTKTKHALSSGLIPIVCIGEKKRDEDAEYLSHLRAQIDAVYGGLNAKEQAAIVLAYEPVWAIGKSASDGITPDDLIEMIRYIRKVLATYMPAKKAEQVAILYGGAVEPSNAKALAYNTGIDGLLVGHASTDAKSFTALVKDLP
jgi:triosephosphate isomerase (TIM)